MKERPILFSAPMVCAILAGQKTQTRRIYKSFAVIHQVRMDDNTDICVTDAVCPYGKPGDRLWCRESCWIDGATNHVHYCATDMQNAPKKTPSIFMPRWASRIILEVVAVRVERLQEITKEDCLTEGIRPVKGNNGDPTYAYSRLWESINGSGSWDANPFVWVITFKRVEKKS